jgi:hypothetical protein
VNAGTGLSAGEPGAASRASGDDQGVDPYIHLVDVLQRISVHPAKRVSGLTPREWKARFSSNPMTSDLALAQP